MSFDEKIVGSEFLRNGMQNTIPSKNKICTMEKSTNFCAIDGPYGYKWPKLSELHYKLFRTGFDEAHNAAVDITAWIIRLPLGSSSLLVITFILSSHSCLSHIFLCPFLLILNPVLGHLYFSYQK